MRISGVIKYAVHILGIEQHFSSIFLLPEPEQPKRVQIVSDNTSPEYLQRSPELRALPERPVIFSNCRLAKRTIRTPFLGSDLANVEDEFRLVDKTRHLLPRIRETGDNKVIQILQKNDLAIHTRTTVNLCKREDKDACHESDLPNNSELET
jgi:hypothetical protein